MGFGPSKQTISRSKCITMTETAMFRNLSPRTLGFSGSIQSEMIELALTYGFVGMDLDIADFGQQVADFGLEHARRLIDSAQLKIGNYQLPVRWLGTDEEYERDMKRLTHLAELGNELGCSRATTALQPASDTLPYHENFEFHAKRLKEICAALEPLNVRLGVEFIATAEYRKDKAHEFIHDLDATLKLLEMVGAKNIGLTLNPWHLFISGTPVERVKELPVEQIVSVYLTDAVLGKGPEELTDEDRRLPGETGVTPCAELLLILHEKGYDGPVTPAPLRQRLKGQGRQKGVKLAGDAMLKLFNQVNLLPEDYNLNTPDA